MCCGLDVVCVVVVGVWCIVEEFGWVFLGMVVIMLVGDILVF